MGWPAAITINRMLCLPGWTDTHTQARFERLICIILN